MISLNWRMALHFSARRFLFAIANNFLLFDRLLHNFWLRQQGVIFNWPTSESIKIDLMSNICWSHSGQKNFRSLYTWVWIYGIFITFLRVYGANIDSIEETNNFSDKIIIQTCDMSHSDFDLASKVFVRNVKWSSEWKKRNEAGTPFPTPERCVRWINFDRRNRRKNKTKNNSRKSEKKTMSMENTSSVSLYMDMRGLNVCRRNVNQKNIQINLVLTGSAAAAVTC